MLGNSLTTANDLPALITNMVGADVIVHARGGARLAEQLNPRTRLGALTQHALESSSWDYEVYIDQNQDLKRAMNVVNVPHTFIIDGKGNIVWQHTAFVEGSEEEVIELIRRLNKGEDISE